MSSTQDIISPGDIVYVQTTHAGQKQGIVVGAHFDYVGRQILEVQLTPNEIFHAWYPTVTRVKRTIAYSHTPMGRQRTIERRIYW